MEKRLYREITMEIIDIITKIEENLETKDNLSEQIYNASIKVSKLTKEYREKYGKKLIEVQHSTRLPMQLVESLLATEKAKVEVAEAEKMFLYNRLENCRQELNILVSLMKNETELIK